MSTVLSFEFQIDSGASSSSYTSKALEKSILVTDFVNLPVATSSNAGVVVAPGFPLVESSAISATGYTFDRCGCIVKNTGATNTVTIAFMNADEALFSVVYPTLGTIDLPPGKIAILPGIIGRYCVGAIGTTFYNAGLNVTSTVGGAHSTISTFFWRK